MKTKYNSDGLIPAIIQDVETKTVLMLGYMNTEAIEKTMATKRVTFFSRSKQRIWTKGEDDIRDRLNDLESNMYRATVNKQGQLKKYVENIHDKFNARINDRLENKQVDDNIKVIKSYGDYVTRTHKLQ